MVAWELGTYYAAVIENHADFHGKVVVDVGAGSGILSLFAAQASVNFFFELLILWHVDCGRLQNLSKRGVVLCGKVCLRDFLSEWKYTHDELLF